MDAPGRSAPRRLAVGGFVVGFLLPVPVALAALLVPLAERVAPVLTPGVALLRPLSASMATWPGAVNMLLASLSNGVVFGVVAGCVGVLLQRGR